MKYYTRIVKKYKPGDIIFSEHSECDGMYIVDSGKVRIFKTVVKDDTPREIDLVTLGPKAMFGEMAMIDNSPRSASVQAVDETECTLITRQIFEDQLSKIPTWMFNLIKILVQRLRETNDKLRHTVEKFTAAPAVNDTGSILTVKANEAPDMTGGEGQAPDPEKKNSSSTRMVKPTSGENR